MSGYGGNEQTDRCKQRQGNDAADDDTQDTIQGMLPHAMCHHRRRDQHRNENRKDPFWAGDQGSRQRNINSTNGKQRQYHLPTRLRLVDLPDGLTHVTGIPCLGLFGS